MQGIAVSRDKSSRSSKKNVPGSGAGTGRRNKASALPATSDVPEAEFILENSADAIFTLDRERRILTANPALERLIGLPRRDIIGRYCFEVLGLEDNQGVSLCQIRCPVLQEASGYYDLEGILTGKDGHKVDVMIRYSLPPPDSQISLPAVVNICDMGGIARADNLSSTLVATVSHELQTPISIIKAYASTLARPDVRWNENTIRDKLQSIEEESDRLSELVGRLLYASRIDSGVLPLNRMVVDLPKEVGKVVKRLKKKSDIHELIVDFPSDFPPVMADPEKLEDVLTNLLDNAIKFSPNGGRITAKGAVSGGEVTVTIADEGVGIAPAEQELIFDRFYRTGDAVVKAIQGVGLGLYICRSIVEAHGGRIWVKSNRGKGSQFIFTLPVAVKQ